MAVVDYTREITAWLGLKLLNYNITVQFTKYLKAGLVQILKIRCVLQFVFRLAGLTVL